jgi:hypothetical protein
VNGNVLALVVAVGEVAVVREFVLLATLQI